ncbi:MAG: RNA polymerase factor sigma-54 [Lentisphaeria bacterium]|jgi:RNA polymerase sigma-54 factor|nr:RNA polymerase factor sigma-54 [Lentisphaeria bacterium]
MIELAIDHQQSVSLRQEQTLTQQQIQAIEMLAAPLLELQAYVTSELQENPLLEAEPGDEESIAPAAETADSADGGTGDDDDWIRQLVELNEPVFNNFAVSAGVSAEEEERRNHFLNSIAAHTTLEDSLLEQIRFLRPGPDVFACCEVIIAALDDDGYLASHPADLAMALGRPAATIGEAIRVVQSCDPAGVGARDLRERLLIQLDRNGGDNELARRLVEDHLDDLGANRIPTLARRLNTSLGEIREALAIIRELRPRIADCSPPSHELEIEPEADIEERGGKLDVQLRRTGIPSLRISAQYRALLADPATTSETREYIKEKIRSAAFLINCIDQRQSTLERIVRAIVEAQDTFFRRGTEHLRPLTMAEVAERIGVHETTVSRGVAGKYLSCKFGVLPLRSFFSNGYCDEEGNNVSSQVVKQAVRQLIGGEDRSRPLSDSQISTILVQKGLRVARRTVAKYREGMGLLPANLRRQYW